MNVALPACLLRLPFPVGRCLLKIALKPKDS